MQVSCHASLKSNSHYQISIVNYHSSFALQNGPTNRKTMMMGCHCETALRTFTLFISEKWTELSFNFQVGFLFAKSPFPGLNLKKSVIWWKASLPTQNLNLSALRRFRGKLYLVHVLNFKHNDFSNQSSFHGWFGLGCLQIPSEVSFVWKGQKNGLEIHKKVWKHK